MWILSNRHEPTMIVPRTGRLIGRDTRRNQREPATTVSGCAWPSALAARTWQCEREGRERFLRPDRRPALAAAPGRTCTRRSDAWRSTRRRGDRIRAIAGVSEG